VFSLSDISDLSKEYSVLKCLYEDSLLIKVFPALSRVRKSDLNYQGAKIKSAPKKTHLIFEQAMLASKLNQYVETHNVYLSKKLKSAFYLASRKDCSTVEIFKDKDFFTSSFKKVLASEIFLRKRFLGEKSRSLKPKDANKALLFINSLLDIIDKQVDSENYWKQ
jgi:hypothetical protein